MEYAEEKQEQVLEISSLSKWKRFLAFLADFFLIFIASLTLFHLAAHPLSKVMTGYDGRKEETSLAQKRRDSVLYGNKILVSPSPAEQETRDFSANLSFTFECYVYSFLGEAVNVEKYASKAADYFHTYYVTIRQDVASYKALYRDLDTTGFFEVGDKVTLKSVYVEEFKHAFLPGDELSTQGKADYETLQSKVFLKGYNRVLDDISAKDLVFADVSYKKEQQKVSDFIAYEKTMVIVDAFVAYGLSCFIVTLLIPLISKERKTLGLLFLREVRLDSELLVLPKRRRILLFFVYQLLMNIGSLFFVPMGAYDFVSLFSLPILFPVSVIGLVYLLFSLIYMLFEPYNRTIADRLSGTVMVTEDTLDKIYQAKGYKI